MSMKEKLRIDRLNAWRNKYPYLDPLTPHENNALFKLLAYGNGSPEHLEACAALAIAIEEQNKLRDAAADKRSNIFSRIQCFLKKCLP